MARFDKIRWHSLIKFYVRFHAMNTKWFFRYVDDIFMTLQEDLIEETLDVVSIHPAFLIDVDHQVRKLTRMRQEKELEKVE